MRGDVRALENLGLHGKHWDKIIGWAGHRIKGSQRGVSAKGPKEKNSSKNPSKTEVFCFRQLHFSLTVFFMLFWGYFIKAMDPSDRYIATGWNKKRKNICYTMERTKIKKIFRGEALETTGLYISTLLLSFLLGSQKLNALWLIRSLGEALKMGWWSFLCAGNP